MKRQVLGCCLAFLFLSLQACDDRPTTLCQNLECGHGSCFLEYGSESCVCDKGYALDSEGSCTKCDSGYSMENGVCVAEICTGHCTGSHEVCNSSSGKPECVCEPGYSYVGNVCSLPDSCKTTFRYSNSDASGNVYLMGTFNNWNKSPEYLFNDLGGGNYELSLFIDPGQHEYKFFVENWGDGGWMSDPNASASGNDGNSVIFVEDCAAKLAEAALPHLVLLEEPVYQNGTVTVHAQFVPGSAGSGISGVPTVTRDDGSPVTVQYDAASSQFTISESGFTDGGKIAYHIHASDLNGQQAEELFVPVWLETTKFDWRDSVMYFAMTDRFYNGDTSNDAPLGESAINPLVDWMGGDFAGLKAKVEEGYFTDLGVNTIWISPVSQNPSGFNTGSDNNRYSAYHGYWPVSSGWYEQNQMDGVSPTEPHFGTLDELKSFINAAHKRGIRVMFDLVANHVHSESPLFIQHQEDNWFNLSPKHVCDQGYWDSEPLTCWFSEDLPDINYNNSDIRKIMVRHAEWLIRETNVDGFRLDAVKHMVDSYLLDLRAAVDKIFDGTGVKFYMIGETFDTNPDLLQKYISPRMLDGQFDFGIYYQVLNAFVRGWGKFWEIKDFVAENDTRYHDAIMGTFMGNHDVPRAISYAAGHIDDSNSKGQSWNGNVPEVTADNAGAYLNLKIAWTFLMTSPGIPLIYYGDEYGLEGAGDPGNRLMMEFGSALNSEQATMLKFVQALGQIRKNHKALSRGTRQTIDGRNDSWLYKMSDGNETIWVGISRADYEEAYENLQTSGKGWTDLLNQNQQIPASNRIVLLPRQLMVWLENK